MTEREVDVPSKPEKSERLHKRSVQTITTRKTFKGRAISEKTVITEKLEYVDLEDVGLKEKMKKVLEETPSIPKELQDHAESFISRIYADAKEYWNASAIGDVEGIELKAGYQKKTNEEPKFGNGEILRNRMVKPETLLRLCNNVFSSPEGQNNKDFQSFLKRWIGIRMGIKEEKKVIPDDKTF